MKKWLMAAAVAVAGLAGADARAQGQGQAPVYAQGNGSCANGECAGGGAPAYGGGYAEGGGYGYVGPHFKNKAVWSRAVFGSPYFSSHGNPTPVATPPGFIAAPWDNYWAY